MRRTLLAAALLLGAGAALAGPTDRNAGWPSVNEQLQSAGVIPGSALERLILENQDFGRLRADEARDTLGLPGWLRVMWRKAHPELEYSAKDPTGGYPRVLREVLEWMLSHQDLQPTPDADEKAARDMNLGPEYGDASQPDAISVGANVRASGAQTSPRSESDIRINYWNTLKVIAGSNNISASGRQAMFYSADGGATWGQTLLPLTSTDAFHSDPTVDWTSDGTAWSTTIGINASVSRLRMRSYRSTTSGSSWTFETTFSGSQNSADKQMVWTDHSASSSFPNNIYACWHNGNPQYFNRRSASAGTWLATPVQLSGAETTGTAIGCDVKTNSAGHVFVFWPATGNAGVFVRKSTNGGSTWATTVKITNTKDSYDIGIPSFASRRALIYVSGGAYRTATRDEVYAAWTDLSGDAGCTAPANEPGTNAASACKTRIWFSRSTNGGTTWSAPAKINNPASNNDQFNQWLAVDETNGRIGVIYYDTVGDATRKKTHLYYQSSSDGGVTWSAAAQVTSAQTDETVAGANSGNQYGDYNALSGYLGTFLPSWTDRRSGSFEEIWTAPIQDP